VSLGLSSPESFLPFIENDGDLEATLCDVFCHDVSSILFGLGSVGGRSAERWALKNVGKTVLYFLPPIFLSAALFVMKASGDTHKLPFRQIRTDHGYLFELKGAVCFIKASLVDSNRRYSPRMEPWGTLAIGCFFRQFDFMKWPKRQ